MDVRERALRMLDKIKKKGWKKAEGGFRDGPGSYCILGAITKVYEEETGDPMYDEDGDPLHGDSSLHPRVRDYYGFTSCSPKVEYCEEELELPEVNDGAELGLKRIVNLIKAQAERVFTWGKQKEPPKETLSEYLGDPLKQLNQQRDKVR